MNSTSCTRTMSAPLAIAIATLAAVPASRSLTGLPVIAPSVDLREVPTRIGRPSTSSSGSRVQHLDIVLLLPAKPEAGVNNDLFLRHARCPRDPEALLEPGNDVARHVVELASPLVVHHDRRHTALGAQPGNPLILSEAPDVVDQRRAGVERRLGHLQLVGVDTQGQRRRLAQGLDSRDNPRQLLRHADRVRPRPRRFTPHVEQVGAGRLELFALLHRIMDGSQPVAREGVRRDVDYAHDIGSPAPLEVAATNGDRSWQSHGARQSSGPPRRPARRRCGRP